jgi:hypothetical protein
LRPLPPSPQTTARPADDKAVKSGIDPFANGIGGEVGRLSEKPMTEAAPVVEHKSEHASIASIVDPVIDTEKCSVSQALPNPIFGTVVAASAPLINRFATAANDISEGLPLLLQCHFN